MLIKSTQWRSNYILKYITGNLIILYVFTNTLLGVAKLQLNLVLSANHSANKSIEWVNFWLTIKYKKRVTKYLLEHEKNKLT